MYVIKAPVPRKDIMPIFYGKVASSRRILDKMYVVLRCDDKVYNPKKPTKESVAEVFERPFGDSAHVANLRNLTSWQVVDDGIFFVKHKEGLFYFHRSGRVYEIDSDENIADISFENGIVKAYSIENVRQTAWNQHFDTYGGYSEEWRDYYEINKKEVNKYYYKEILNQIRDVEAALWLDFYPKNAEEFHFFEHMDGLMTTSLDFRNQILHGVPYRDLQNCTEVVGVAPLLYRDKLFGYRFYTDGPAFDVEANVAKKYGLDKVNVNMEDGIELIRLYNLLIDEKEAFGWKNGEKTINDISGDELCCKKLQELLSK